MSAQLPGESFEDYLVRALPAVPWREPIRVHLLGQEAPVHACRICIAKRGLQAADIAGMLAGQQIDVPAWLTPAACAAHIAAVHPETPTVETGVG